MRLNVSYWVNVISSSEQWIVSGICVVRNGCGVRDVVSLWRRQRRSDLRYCQLRCSSMPWWCKCSSLHPTWRVQKTYNVRFLRILFNSVFAGKFGCSRWHATACRTRSQVCIVGESCHAQSPAQSSCLQPLPFHPFHIWTRDASLSDDSANIPRNQQWTRKTI